MNLKNLTLDVESIALALSEEGGYEYYDIDDELKELAKNVSDMQAENGKLRELARDMYCLAYPSAVEWEVSDAVYDKYSPCERCKELHGGKSPCASTSEDMTEDCCEPIQAVVVADHMRELGIEVKE